MVAIKLTGGTQGHGPLHTRQKDRYIYILASYKDVRSVTLYCSSPMNIHGRETVTNEAQKASASEL